MTLSCVRGVCSVCVSGVFRSVQTVTVVGRAKLRPALNGHHIVPVTKSKAFGSHSFRFAAPTARKSNLVTSFTSTNKVENNWQVDLN